MKSKVGIVGLGWFGSFHLDQLLTMDDVEVVALCTANTERIEKAHEKVPHAKCFSHHKEMIEEMDLDAIYICVTPSRHEDIELLAAKKGIAMYIEKPIGLCLDEVKNIELAISTSKLIHSIGYQERYSALVGVIQNWLKEETPVSVRGKWIDTMPDAPWWRQMHLSGGQVVEQATHIIDMMRYLFGEMEIIQSLGVKGYIKQPNYDVVDASLSLLYFPRGMIGTLECGCYLDKNQASDIGIEIQGVSSKLVYHWQQQVVITKGETEEIYTQTESSHYRSSRRFIEAVKQQNQSLILSNYSDASKTLASTMRINEIMEVKEKEEL